MPTKPKPRIPQSHPVDLVPEPAWRALYEAAARVAALEPWEALGEEQLFGVQPVPQDPVQLVSVMGMRGEYRAVCLYSGEAVLDLFWRTHSEVGQLEAFELALGTEQLHMEYVAAVELDPEEKALLKRLGLKVRGMWPKPRSRKPGHQEWFLDAGEVRLLTAGLEQLAEMVPRMEGDPELLGLPTDDHYYEYLVRVAQAGGWRDNPRTVRLRPEAPPETPPDIDLAPLAKLPPSEMDVEVDLAFSGMPVGKPGARALIAYMLIVADRASGMVLGVEPLTAEPDWDSMWRTAAARAIALAAQAGALPGRVTVRSPRLARLLASSARALKFQLGLSERLPLADSVFAQLAARMGR